MKELVKEISNDIKGEQLLFSNKVDFDKNEEKLIINTVAKRFRNKEYYDALIYPFFNKLNMIMYDIGTDIDEDTREDILEIACKMVAWNKKTYNEQEFDIEYVHYFLSFYGYRWSGTYCNTMKHRVIDIEEMTEAYDSNNVYEKYNNSINFLITNNLLIRRYPEFYNEEYIAQLRRVAEEKDKRCFLTHNEYKEFKENAKITLRNIEQYENRKTPKIKRK